MALQDLRRREHVLLWRATACTPSPPTAPPPSRAPPARRGGFASMMIPVNGRNGFAKLEIRVEEVSAARVRMTECVRAAIEERVKRSLPRPCQPTQHVNLRVPNFNAKSKKKIAQWVFSCKKKWKTRT